MLDAFLFRGSRLPDADAPRYVSLDVNMLFVRLVDDREIGISRQHAVNLDEVGAVAHLFVHRLPCLRGRFHADGLRPHRWISIDDRASQVDARRIDLAGGQLRSKLAGVGRPEHFPDSRDAVRQVERKEVGEPRLVIAVNVHVPRPGIRNLPEALTILAPADALAVRLSMTAEIRPPRILTVRRGASFPVSVSMT